MFCAKCGREAAEGSLFCEGCGARLAEQPAVNAGNTGENAPQKNGLAGQKAAVVVLSVLLAAILGAGGFLAYTGGAGGKLDEQYEEAVLQLEADNIPECLEKLDEIKTSWEELGGFSSGQKKELLADMEKLASDSSKYTKKLNECTEAFDTEFKDIEKYKLVENEYAALEAAVSDLKKNIDDRDADKAEKSIAAARESLDSLVQANENYVNGMLEKYNAVNFSIAEAIDINDYNNVLKEVKTAVSERRFDALADRFAILDGIYYKYVEPEKYLNISVEQLDVTAYPNVKLYLDVFDRSTGNVVENLDGGMFFIRKKDANGNYVRQFIKKAGQLNESEALNVDMVADISGSMEGAPLNTAKDVMNQFINSVQFGVGDMVELISFSDGVYIEEPFTSDAVRLISRVNSLTTQNMTAFYDALYTAVNKVAVRSGARCVIAFTDGLDNYSSCTSADVIQLAQRYHIPIFIIGIGNEDYYEARGIAEQTGGLYFSAYNIYDMGSIYAQIYRQEKQMYLLEFEDSSAVNLFSESNIVAGYHTQEYGGEVNYSYTPHALMSVNSTSMFNDGPEATVAAYMIAFADAMTSRSFSPIQPYILPGSPIAAEQQKYVQRGIEETINSYEIENVEYSDTDHCIVTTRETYFVQKPGEPLALLTQRCKYAVERTSGRWQITRFAEKVEVLSNIKY